MRGPKTYLAVLRVLLWAGLLGISVCSKEPAGTTHQPVSSVGKNRLSGGTPPHPVCRTPFSSSSRSGISAGMQNVTMNYPCASEPCDRECGDHCRQVAGSGNQGANYFSLSLSNTGTSAGGERGLCLSSSQKKRM